MLSPKRKSLNFILLAIIANLYAINSNAQALNSLSGGSARDFQITVTNSFGVRNSIDTNSNVKTVNSARVNLLPGSVIDDAFGDSQGNANANFTVTPGGGNMTINGIQSRNTFLFGSGTQFTSDMQSIDNPDPSKPIKGTASSMAVHELNIKVQQQQSAFSSSFSQNF